MKQSRPVQRTRKPSRSPATEVATARDATITPLVVGACVFVVAFAVRLIYLWQIRQAPFFSILLGDSKGYDAWAQQIAAGDWIGRDVFYQAPLYPYVLGAIYRLLGHDVLAVRVGQSLLGAISCGLLMHAAWRLFSRRAGMIAGAILAFYPTAIFFDGLLQKTALDAFFTSVALWIISGMLVGSGGWFAWAGLGLTMGALSLTRENALVLVVVLAVWCLAPGAAPRDRVDLPISAEAGPRVTSGFRTRAVHLAAFVLGLALLLLPVAIRNYAVGGGWYLTTSQFGPNLYLGNNARTDGTAGSLIAGRGSSEYERQDAIDIAERRSGRRLTPAEVSSYWTGQTLAFIRSSPSAWLTLMVRKFALLWNVSEAFDTESQESYAEWSWPMRIGSVVGHFGVLVPLAFVGVCVTWNQRRRLAILYVLAATYSASVVLFFIYARYRYPLVPFLVLFAAAGLSEIVSYLRSQSSRRIALVAAATFLVVAFTNWPILSVADNRAVTEHNLGAALQADGQLDAAIDRYRRAIAIKADYAPSYTNMGAALLAKGLPVEAVAAYEHALAVAPDSSDAHFNIGNALLQQGNPRAAVEHFLRALRTSPDAVDIRTNLGVALIADHRLDEGIGELQTAVGLAPRSAEAQRALGEALSERGSTAEALEHLQQAVAIAPGSGRARYALGRLLLEQQRLPEAIDQLRAALQDQSAPAEVDNDLGVALASSGRVDEAIVHFRQALRQRPDYAEAQQNLAAANAAAQHKR